MKINHLPQQASADLPAGFLYVGQDNYFIANLNSEADADKKYLYSDSATSCIIIVVEGKNQAGDPIVALSHLSRKERFLSFFHLVQKTFRGPTNVFAQGANPPQPAVKDGKTTFTSLLNQQTVLNWINDNISGSTTPPAAGGWYIVQSTVSLGMGNPQLKDRGCYGVDLGTMIVSNHEYALSPLQRDPTGGVQTLFCVFGLKVQPQIVLPEATRSFTDEQIAALVAAANAENWTSILKMTKDEVLNKYSSTPQFEAPWFYESLRDSAKFVQRYNNQGC